MYQEVDIKIALEQLHEEDAHLDRLAKTLKTGTKSFDYRLLKRSIDARSRTPYYLLRYGVWTGEAKTEIIPVSEGYRDVSNAPEVLILGAGPAGYFAALECLLMGLRPIVLERGKDVRARRRDLRAIQQFGEVNPHSNYCFGEGGAGTYSDGKLYTRSHKRGSIEKVLQQFVEHGATKEILVDAHPHIGSNKLPEIVANMRHTIEQYGGSVIFDCYVTDLIMDGKELVGVMDANGKIYKAAATILATGHSARDIFYLLDAHQIYIEAKSFALGVRIEHSQSFIDQKQYKSEVRHPNLPAASYSVSCQVDDLGVFSFCMCPGGLIVPASTAPGELVVNGMSLSRRDSPFSNSGFVTAIEIEELAKHGYRGKFASLDFQKSVEQALFAAGDGTQKAPAQRATDFVKNLKSASVNDTSYIPGLYPAPMHQLLPKFVAHRLQRALVDINKKMNGYLTPEANIIGTESRTSSPVKVPRDPDTLMHISTKRLFPCGEGAGYAGGILSAAMDGQRVAQAVAQFLGK